MDMCPLVYQSSLLICWFHVGLTCTTLTLCFLLLTSYLAPITKVSVRR